MRSPCHQTGLEGRLWGLALGGVPLLAAVRMSLRAVPDPPQGTVVKCWKITCAHARARNPTPTNTPTHTRAPLRGGAVLAIKRVDHVLFCIQISADEKRWRAKKWQPGIGRCQCGFGMRIWQMITSIYQTTIRVWKMTTPITKTRIQTRKQHPALAR